jgi:hypothetical protein
MINRHYNLIQDKKVVRVRIAVFEKPAQEALKEI